MLRPGKGGSGIPMRLPLPKTIQRRLSAGSVSDRGSKSPQKEDISPILRKYHDEEDRFLEQLDALQHSITATPDQFSAAEMDESFCPSSVSSMKSSPRKLSQQQDWRKTSSYGVSPHTDLLGSFCHLMNYVIFLRRENRDLRKEVACLGEMRKIEQLQHDLVTASCSCDLAPVQFSLWSEEKHPGPPVGAEQRKSVGERRKDSKSAAINNTPAASDALQPADDASPAAAAPQPLPTPPQRKTPARKLLKGNGDPAPPPGSAPPRKQPSSSDKVGAEAPSHPATGPEATMRGTTRLPADSRRRSHRTDSPLKENGSAFPFGESEKWDGPGVKRREPTYLTVKEGAQESLATPPPHSHQDPMTASSYSADISSAGDPSVSFRNKKKERRTPDSDEQPIFTEVDLPSPRRNCSPDSSAYSPIGYSKPFPSAGKPADRSSFLERLGIRKKPQERKLSSDEKPLSQSLYSEPSSLDRLSHSFSRDPISVKVKRAFVKKRKRRISESDSLASSERSGKPYKIIDFPEEPGTRKALTLQEMEKNLSAAHVRKMKEWEQKRGLSQKGESVKKSWLKTPKLKVETSPTSPERRYFEQSLDGVGPAGRQNTVIHKEPDEEGRVVSDGSIQPIKRTSRSSPDLPKLVEQKPAMQKSRSVAFNQSDPLPSPGQTTGNPSLADSISISCGLFTESEDSVFTSEDASGGNLLGHLISLQEKNSNLIQTLNEKSREHEHISHKLATLEREFRMLKGRYKLDACVESLFVKKGAEMALVPMAMLDDLEGKMREVDGKLKKLKSETFHSSLEALEVQSTFQASNQKRWDHFEEIQREKLKLIQRALLELSVYDPSVRHNLELIPTYEALYSFTINLFRKLRQLRSELEERIVGGSRLDLELLQTQSSLLLAHAQIERLKLELRAYGRRERKRPHSFHGEDLLSKTLNPELSFYLPFKLHARKTGALKRHSAINADQLEEEFLKLFSNVGRMTDRPSLPVEPPPSIPPLKYQNYRNSPVLNNYRPPPVYAVSPLAVRRTAVLGVDQSNYPEMQYNRLAQRAVLSEQNLYYNKRPANVYLLNPMQYQVQDSQQQQGKRPLSLIETTSEAPNSGSFAQLSGQPLMRRRAVFTSQRQERIDSSDMVQMATEFVNRAEDEVFDEDETSPAYRKKAPPPLRLGNTGQVRSLAANFDASSAPNTPLSKTAPHLLQVSGIPSSPLSSRLIQVREGHYIAKRPDEKRHYDTPPSSYGRFQPGPTVTSRIPQVQPYALTRIPYHRPEPYRASPGESRKSADEQYESLSLRKPQPKGGKLQKSMTSDASGSSGRLLEPKRKLFFGQPRPVSKPAAKKANEPSEGFCRPGTPNVKPLTTVQLNVKPDPLLRNKTLPNNPKEEEKKKKRSSWIMKLRGKK